MRRTLSFASFSQPHRGNVWVVTGVTFALGLLTGAMLRPSPHGAVPVDTALASAPSDVPTPADMAVAHRLDPALAYPADVLRVIDGDTFEARVRVWPGLDVDTKVRLRNIDAAELHARCAGELAKAQAARTALETILADGGVTISRVGVDKYGGRVDAAVSTRNTADVSAALLNGGYARSSWCG